MEVVWIVSVDGFVGRGGGLTGICGGGEKGKGKGRGRGWRLLGERGGRLGFGGERRGPSTPPPAMRLREAPLRMTG